MLQFVDVVLPSLLVLIGWWVVYWQTLRIKRRDDLQLLVEKATNLVEEIRCDSLEYFTDAQEVIGPRSAKIRADFVLLSKYLLLLRQRGLPLCVSAHLTEFRRNAMGGYFENVEVSKQVTIPNWFSELANSRTQMIYLINKDFLDWCHK